MASGDIVGIIHAVTPPATNYATPDIIAGADAGEAEAVPVWAFDDTVVEVLDFYGVLDGYAGGGTTVTYIWGAAAATNQIKWKGAFRSISDDDVDLDTTDFAYDFNTSADLTVPTAIGEVSYDDLTFTDGADMDSLADGQYFLYRIEKIDGTTPLTGDAYLHTIVIRET